MTPEPLTPDNTTVVLIDYAVGFVNNLRSHDTADHLNNVVGLAKTAVWYESGLVVTNGQPSHPAGPLYPELLDVLGDQEVIERPPSAFNAFLDDAFADAVRRTGRKNLVIGGIATDGCVLQAVLGALREDYTTHVVVDAVASPSKEAHDTAIQRMTMAGAVPVSWYSLAAEFNLEPRFAGTDYRARLMLEHMPIMRMGVLAYRHGIDRGQQTVTARQG